MRSSFVPFLAASTLLLAGPALAAKPVIGFVDVVRLQQEFGQASRVRHELEAETQKYEAELREGQQKLADIEARIASADAAVRAATGDVAVRKQLEAAKEDAEANREKTQQDYSRRLAERRQRAEDLQKQLGDDLLARAKGAIAQVAKKRGLDGVIDSRASLWGAVDLTEEVLKVLNASSSQGK
ncbi:MAG: OmpH family outer membrane protein [Candidatus Sericytochromatia bacterium]|nr:OmpH family outer membrane protein [Candidatus Tanganyikabacteria bacterium]